MDKIAEKFMQRQVIEAADLTSASDLVQIHPLRFGDGVPQHYHARFRCLGLVKTAAGQVVKHDCFDIGIFLSDDYLRRASTFEVLTWLGPTEIFHPNISPPAVCLGESFFRPGVPLIEIAYQLHSLITYRRWAPHAGLNPDACQYARNHQDQFPIDTRPLKRRKLNLEIEAVSSVGRIS